MAERDEMIKELNDSTDMEFDAKAKVCSTIIIGHYFQARYAVENLKKESFISAFIKKFFDKKYGPNWHCIVGKLFFNFLIFIGKQFNSYVSYEAKHYIFFYEG